VLSPWPHACPLPIELISPYIEHLSRPAVNRGCGTEEGDAPPQPNDSRKYTWASGLAHLAATALPRKLDVDTVGVGQRAIIVAAVMSCLVTWTESTPQWVRAVEPCVCEGASRGWEELTLEVALLVQMPRT
jgi:hypothetical protein